MNDQMLNPALLQRQKETVLALAAQGRETGVAREMTLSAFFLADYVMRQVEAANPLPYPLACAPGCCFCCFNLVEVTPPELFLLSDFIAHNFSPQDQDRLGRRLARTLEAQTGKSKVELARGRRRLPCPLLHRRGCQAYPVRPLACRAMHALDAGQCRRAFADGDRTRVSYYNHPGEIIFSVVRGLQAGCAAARLQSGAVNLAWGLQACLLDPTLAARWLLGETVFPVGHSEEPKRNKKGTGSKRRRPRRQKR
jgi:Fe-S-cluster containining protein